MTQDISQRVAARFKRANVVGEETFSSPQEVVNIIKMVLPNVLRSKQVKNPGRMLTVKVLNPGQHLMTIGVFGDALKPLLHPDNYPDPQAVTKEQSKLIDALQYGLRDPIEANFPWAKIRATWRPGYVELAIDRK